MSLKAEEDASGLVAALEGGVFAARVQAARVLWWLASECPDIVLPFLPHLVAALKDNCRDVRKWAAGALCKVAKKRPNAIASHVSALVSAGSPGSSPGLTVKSASYN